ncbi:MAG: hypothetical protein BWY72_01889 [Bacteroidetes bacterium ADurb.Bin416]|nr:MAG: hypothetical protein BWY72_01889 [Bacteroidetes bacterium ADurb.Bin416]
MAQLQQCLATSDVVYPSLGPTPPGLVTLEKEADTVEGHARFTVQKRIVDGHVEKQLIEPQRELPVQQRLMRIGCFLPSSTQLSKALGHHQVLAINMGSRNGVQHIVGLIVRGTFVPKFPHGQINRSMMQ